TDRVLPDGCIDIVWTGGRLIVAGPDTHHVPLPRRPGARFVGLRFRPGFAPAVLRAPASVLVDRRIDLGEVNGARAPRLDDGRRCAPSLGAAADTLAPAVIGWLADSHAPDRMVEAAVARLRAAESPRPVAALAR